MSQYTEAQQQILIKYLGTVAMVFNECEMSYYNDYGFNSDGTLWFKLEGDGWQAEGSMSKEGELSEDSQCSDDTDESDLGGLNILTAMNYIAAWHGE